MREPGPYRVAELHPDVLTSSDEQRNGVNLERLPSVTSAMMKIDMTHEHGIAWILYCTIGEHFTSCIIYQFTLTNYSLLFLDVHIFIARSNT